MNITGVEVEYKCPCLGKQPYWYKLGFRGDCEYLNHLITESIRTGL